MSKFRIELDITFDKKQDAVDFLNHLQDKKEKLFTGKGDEHIAIITKCRYHECFHDEIPPKQCGNYIDYDLKKKEKEVINAG